MSGYRGTTATHEAPARSSALSLILAWALVGIPLVWGVWETALASAKLFQ